MAIPIEVLESPLVWRDPLFIPLLAQLQGNILKGHGRDHTRNLFLRFGTEPREARRVLAQVAQGITSAIEQLSDAARYRADGTPAGPVRFLFLSAAGYRALGIPKELMPADPAFRAGMAARTDEIGDADPASWEALFQGAVDGLLIVGADEFDVAETEARRIERELACGGISLVFEQAGEALRRGGPKGPGIEHFGYVDGRSQPLMLADEVTREEVESGGPLDWNPAFGPAELALVKDPGNAAEDAYGSYLVFRKLEQDVAAFDAAEAALAVVLGHADSDLAGAFMVGRFEDGTPVFDSDRPLGGKHVANGFDFSADPDALRCPFQAHIRKANPRGDTVRKFGADLKAERAHLMPRRGITYGRRETDLSDLPSGGVGLLFMAYNQDIARQFEFVQKRWVDNPAFVTGTTGVDPVLGPDGSQQAWPVTWNDPNAELRSHSLGGFVRMLGGEYFFAPSIGFFTAIAEREEAEPRSV